MTAYLKTLKESLKYYFFEVRGSWPFRMKYFFEKFFQYFVAIVNARFRYHIHTPYFFGEDYIIINNEGSFLIQSHTDFDYHIQPYYETQLLPYFRLPKGGIFVDIGAHFGRYSLMMAKIEGVTAYAFEPNIKTRSYLERNIQLNHLSGRITVIPKGVSSSSGRTSFISFQENTGSSRIVLSEKDISEGKGLGTRTEIDLTSFDEFIEEFNLDVAQIRLIKIDVEEHEYEVFQGMKLFLSRATDGVRIICEVLNPEKKQQIDQMLTSYGFSCSPIDAYNFLYQK